MGHSMMQPHHSGDLACEASGCCGGQGWQSPFFVPVPMAVFGVLIAFMFGMDARDAEGLEALHGRNGPRRLVGRNGARQAVDEGRHAPPPPSRCRDDRLLLRPGAERDDPGNGRDVEPR